MVDSTQQLITLSEDDEIGPPIPPTIGLTPSASSPAVGQSLTITAAVGLGNPGGPTPTGAVQFEVDGADLGQPVTLGSGSATSPTIADLGAGFHAITAVYSGDATYAQLSQSTTVNITPQPEAKLILGSSANPAVVGTPLSFSFAAYPTSNTSMPTGTVQFEVDGTNFGAPVTAW